MDGRYNCFSFNGKISDFKIWKVALSQEQVLEKMWNYSVNDPQLLGCWWFIDEKDLSGNKNHLKFREIHNTRSKTKESNHNKKGNRRNKQQKCTFQ